jgi:branched-chain amino acid transport system permease protein
MFGAYSATFVFLKSGVGLLALALVAVLGTVLAGGYVERLCFAPHRRGSALAAMVASFAIWMQLEELATLLLPRHLYSFPALYEGGPLSFGPFFLRVESMFILGIAASVCFLLWRMLYRTHFGIAVRAVTDNAAAAELSGINVGAVSVRIFALASAIGGLTGFLIVASHEQVTPMLGMWSTLKGMLAMMLGGLGSLPGAVIGGLALGLIEAHSQWYFGPQFRDFIAYLLLFALLAVRPPWMNTRSAY